MSADLQFWIVVVAVAVAALYAGRRVLAQFERSDDEPAACASCPAAEAYREAGRSGSSEPGETPSTAAAGSPRSR